MNTRQRERIIKSLNLMSSVNDGEALAAARAAVRLVESLGESFDSIIGDSHAINFVQGEVARSNKLNRRSWKMYASFLHRNSDDVGLNAWEKSFVGKINSSYSHLTDKQWVVLRRIMSEKGGTY